MDADVNGLGGTGQSVTESKYAQFGAPFAAFGSAIQRFQTTAEADWYATLRAKAGLLLSPTLLAYATGGLAVGEVKSTTVREVYASNLGYQTPLALANANTLATISGCPAVGPCFSGSSSEVKIGWTVGGGLEWAFTERISIKAEYLYVNLGGISYNAVSNSASSAGSSIRVQSDDYVIHSARGGLNFRF